MEMEKSEINFTCLNKCISLCAMRASGKSEMLRYLVMAEHHKFQKIFVISPTNITNGFYNDFIPKENIFSEWNNEWIEKLLEILKNLNKNKKSQTDSPKNVLLILDDCCSNTKFHNNKIFERIFTTGRHYFLSCIITSQFITHIPPSARTNCDFILVSNLNNNNVQILANEYTLGNCTRKQFIEIYKKAIPDHGFLLINNSSTQNNNIDEIYGQMKVPIECLKVKN